MSDEAPVWLRYARENLQVAEMTFQAGLLNPCLQNAQQVVEKALKALWVHQMMPVKRTHSIRELNRDLAFTGGADQGSTLVLIFSGSGASIDARPAGTRKALNAFGNSG